MRYRDEFSWCRNKKDLKTWGPPLRVDRREASVGNAAKQRSLGGETKVRRLCSLSNRRQSTQTYHRWVGSSCRCLCSGKGFLCFSCLIEIDSCGKFDKDYMQLYGYFRNGFGFPWTLRAQRGNSKAGRTTRTRWRYSQRSPPFISSGKMQS